MSRILKPVMASTFLRDSSASFARNNQFLSANRYNEIRDQSPADSRSRSPSVKRKSNNDLSYANAAKKKSHGNNGNLRSQRAAKTTVSRSIPCSIRAESVEQLEVNSAKVASICERLHDAILAIPEENPVCPILRQFCEIAHIQNENTKIITDAFRKVIADAAQPPASEPEITVTDSEMDSEPEQPPSVQMVSLGTIPKARGRLFPSSQNNQDSVWAPARLSRPISKTSRVANPSVSPSPPQDPKLQRFKDLVNNAEKSTVVFNLDMGRVPLINKATMGIKATAALTAMAAAAEKRPANNPSPDTVAAIDDALSVAEKISFFGNTTKSAKKGKSDGGAFCTIPVCYAFPDKKTSSRVEYVLRTTCKASCATPYPPAVRECIKLAIEDGRKFRPDDFCSAVLDLQRMCLRLSWRAKGTSTWTRYKRTIPIPENVIESPSAVPEGGIHLTNLPTVSLDSPPQAGAGGEGAGLTQSQISMATLEAQYLGTTLVSRTPTSPP